MDLDSSILVILIMLGLLMVGALPILGIRQTSVWMKNREKQSNPLNERLLRLPGQTVLKKRDEIDEKLDVNAIVFIIIPMAAYVMIFSRFYIFNDVAVLKTSGLVGSIGAVVSSMIYLGVKDFKLLRKRRELTLQLECEITVSQELNQLMREGYYIYHNFPAEDFNIDHIVIGPLGVFAIETLARNKPLTHDDRKQAKVIYNGDSLKFPTWAETQPLEQIKAHAEWLSNWLKEVEGISIKIIPVLTLPGWFVESDEKHSIRVYNPTRLRGKIKANSGNLSSDLMKRIANQVEARCRETEEKPK